MSSKALVNYKVVAVKNDTGFVCTGEDIVVAYKVISPVSNGYLEILCKFNDSLGVSPHVDLVIHSTGASIKGLPLGDVYTSNIGRVTPKVLIEGKDPASLRRFITSGRAPERVFDLATISHGVSKALNSHFSHPSNSRVE